MLIFLVSFVEEKICSLVSVSSLGFQCQLFAACFIDLLDQYSLQGLLDDVEAGGRGGCSLGVHSRCQQGHGERRVYWIFCYGIGTTQDYVTWNRESS